MKVTIQPLQVGTAHGHTNLTQKLQNSDLPPPWHKHPFSQPLRNPIPDPHSNPNPDADPNPVSKSLKNLFRNSLPSAADPDAIRLTLLAEIVSAADFDCDHLYIEYVVRFDPLLWQLETAWPQAEPGILQVWSTHQSGGHETSVDIVCGFEIRKNVRRGMDRHRLSSWKFTCS